MRSALVLCFFACSGAGHPIEVGPPPPKFTQAVLSGPLCHGAQCTCRSLDASDDGGAEVPSDPGRKRFEIRMSSSDDLWAIIGTTRLYKSADQSEACFYLDLPSGEIPVELRASDKNGASGQWAIRELGTQTRSFYDTFIFQCGGSGACAFDELERAKRQYTDLPQHTLDPCGSTKLKGISWSHSRPPDGIHPTDLVVSVKLDIYKFAPSKSHGDATCQKNKKIQ